MCEIDLQVSRQEGRKGGMYVFMYVGMYICMTCLQKLCIKLIHLSLHPSCSILGGVVGQEFDNKDANEEQGQTFSTVSLAKLLREFEEWE